ncbi:MAG: hypothetical protein WC644_01260 [Ignavibacteria bacterium]
MAYNDSKKHFIKITPEFLFDEYDVFISEYTPWVYLSLKFRFNYFLQHAPDKRFKIPTEDITSFFGINSSTVSRAVKELTQKGFLEKTGKLYKIKDEVLYKTKYKPEYGEAFTTKYPDFIKVYFEHLDRMIYRVRDYIPAKYKSNKFILKIFETYYYLISKNRHFLLDREMVASEECINSIHKALNYDNRTVKDILSVLENSSYIKLGADIKITTIDIYFEHKKDTDNKPYIPKAEEENFWPIENIQQKQELQPEEEFYIKEDHVWNEEVEAYQIVKTKVKGKEPKGRRIGGFIYDNPMDEFSEFGNRLNFNYDCTTSNN